MTHQTPKTLQLNHVINDKPNSVEVVVNLLFP